MKKEVSSKPETKNVNYGAFIGLAIIGVLIVLIATFNQEDANTNTTDNVAAEKIVDYTEATTTEDYLSMMKDSSVHIFYVARPTCSYCVKFAPILIDVIEEYDLTVNYINIDEEESSAINRIETSSDKLEGFGTPTLVITQNNEVTYVNIGYIDKEALLKFFEDSKIITE